MSQPDYQSLAEAVERSTLALRAFEEQMARVDEALMWFLAALEADRSADGRDER